MDLLPSEKINAARIQGRHASATVSGRRRSGFLLGNRFVYSDKAGLLWLQAEPGEFCGLRIWRK
ncbi:MAG TPA: hypothetical protein DEA26_00885 [Oceanospirillales bacterium]|nr:hypothetical protein [Oceanospirillaceae bacterium]HBS41204.1 hypothetical protein [Oceanospirillales bacterium]|tara:strand:+ start:845 stop:1036 length:192 start_codon:yes stop_codon:yes gene_type:complete